MIAILFRAERGCVSKKIGLYVKINSTAEKVVTFIFIFICSEFFS